MDNTHNIVQLETERLILRAAVEEDAEHLHEVFKDAEAMRYWSEPPHKDLTRTQEWITSMIQAQTRNGITDFIICLKPSNKPIGKIGVWSGDEIGFILHPSQWRRGLAGEAMERVLGHLLGGARDGGLGLGWESISADTDPRNGRSIALLKGFGFVEERFERGTFWVGGEWVDSLYLRLTKERWNQRNVC